MMLTATAAATAALLMSMVTPRLGDGKWEYGNIGNRLRTGFSEERPAIDLNVSG